MGIEAVFYKALNPVMTGLLRSPLHGIASSNIGILSFIGRRTGRPYATPLSFMREGQTLRLLSSHNTRWWKNFLNGPVEVEFEIGREKLTGAATTITEDSEVYRDGVRRFLTAVPRDARVYGIKLDRDRKPREEDIERAAGHVVLVEIALAS